MKKRIIAISLCLLMVFVFAACKDKGDSADTPPANDSSSEETGDDAADPGADTGDAPADDGEKLKIAYFGGGMQATWLQNILKAMTELGEENGFEVINADAEWDGDKMLSQIDTLLDQGIDGASIFLVDASLGPAVYERFAAADVPLAFDTMEIMVDGKYAAPGVISDVIGMGRIPAEWVIENVDDIGLNSSDWSKTGLMLGTNSIFPPTDDRAIEFRRVFTEAFPDFPEENIFLNDVAADPNRPDDTEGSFNQAMANFTANPQIEQWLVYASVDDYGVGIARAIEANNLQSKAKLISCGGERAMPEWISNPSVNEYWIAELYFNAMEYAEYVVEALMGMIKEGKDAKDVLTDFKSEGEEYGVVEITGRMVTPDTYEEYYLPGY
jgi:ABC-type sugar transport system substrate-binding protein